MLLLAGSATALATGLGAVPVFLLGARSHVLRPALWGFAAGTMAVASVVGLLLPGARRRQLRRGRPAASRWASRSCSATRRFLDTHDVHVGAMDGRRARTTVLVFSVLFVHSVPEGLAIGTAYASETAGLGLYVILAIALQNIPEGTSTAIPMEAAGFGRAQQFWAAVLTSAPQPVAAVIAFLAVEQVSRCCRSRSASRRARCSRWSRSSWFRRRSPAAGGVAPCWERSPAPR